MQQQDVKTGKNDSKEDPNSITNILAMVISILDWLKNAKGTKNELDCPEVCEVSEAVDKLRDMTEKLAEGKCDHGEEPCNCNEDSDTDGEEIFYETQENMECATSKQSPSANKCKGVDCKKCCATGGSVPKSTDEKDKGEGQVEDNTTPQVKDTTMAQVKDNTIPSSEEGTLPSVVIALPADDKSKDQEFAVALIPSDSKKSPKKRNKKAKKPSTDKIVELIADPIAVDDDDEKVKDTTSIDKDSKTGIDKGSKTAIAKGSKKPCNVKKAKKASDDKAADDDGRDKTSDVIVIPDDDESKDKGDELNTASDDKEPSKDDDSEKDKDTPSVEADDEKSKDKDNELNAGAIAIPLQDKPSTEADDEKSKDENADIIAVDDDDKKEKDAASIIVLDDETSKDKKDESNTDSIAADSLKPRKVRRTCPKVKMDTSKEPEAIHGDAEKPSADTNMDPSKVSTDIVDADSPEKPIGLEDKQKPDADAKDTSAAKSGPEETAAADKPKDATAMKECSQCSQTADQLDQAVSAKRTKNFCDCPPTQPSKTDSSTRMNQANVDTEEKTTQAQQCKALFDEQQGLVDKLWVPPCRHGPKTYSGRRRAQQGGYRMPEASEDETMDDDDDDGTFFECPRYPSPTRSLVPVRKAKQPDPYRIQCPQFISSLPYQPSRMPPRNTYGPKGGISFKSYQPCPATRLQSPYEPSNGAPLYGTPVKSKSPTSPPVSSSPYKYNMPASDCARRLIETIMKNPTCPAYEALKKATETPETATEDELYTGSATTGDGSPKSFSSSPKSGGCNDDCLGKKKSTSGSPK